MSSAMSFFTLAAGSALGAIVRYWLVVAGNHYISHRWPWGTLLVNASGALLLGWLMAQALPAERWSQVFAVSALGSYTTVSGFSLDTLLLWRARRYWAALANVLLSVSLSLLLMGWMLTRGGL